MEHIPLLLLFLPEHGWTSGDSLFAGSFSLWSVRARQTTTPSVAEVSMCWEQAHKRDSPMLFPTFRLRAESRGRTHSGCRPF